MNALDAITLGVVVLSAIFAFSRGFSKEILAIGAWIGAGFAALYGLPLARPLAQRVLPTGTIADAVSVIVIFLLCLLVLSFITSALAKRVKDSALSTLDRTLGLIFGVVRGVVLMCLAYIVLAWALPGDQLPAWIEEARTRPFLANGADQLRRLVPASLRSEATRTGDRIHQNVEKGVQSEAEGAIRALTTPKPAPPANGGKPTYKPEEQRDLNRLIEQNSK
ncbi:MAG TPA: CvpA family protein [Stellaceae bacterium]|nr:CvpA family protein [Stellaceae bacterium]